MACDNCGSRFSETIDRWTMTHRGRTYRLDVKECIHCGATWRYKERLHPERKDPFLHRDPEVEDHNPIFGKS